MFYKHFLLTSQKGFLLNWPYLELGSYKFYYHPDLEVSYCEKEGKRLIIAGNIYSWEYPESGNTDLAERLLAGRDLSAVLKECSSYAGEYVVVCLFEGQLSVFSDASGQMEVFYNSQFTTISSQVRLMNEVIDLLSYNDPWAASFYAGKFFSKRGVFIGKTTHCSNVFHLLPNHYLDISQKQEFRFYPQKAVSEADVNEAAETAVKMIKGNLRSASERKGISLALTAGYDSRVLFLASLDLDCSYYICQHHFMRSDHYDITVARKLAEMFDKKLYVCRDKVDDSVFNSREYRHSINFPQNPFIPPEKLKNTIVINGNVSEIARNFYGYFRKYSGKKISLLYGYGTEYYPVREYNSWLKDNQELFDRLGYNILDMFYWEEKMGNWSAKTKGELRTLGYNIFSPFNSRELLDLLLSVNRLCRDAHNNVLYNKMIEIMSGGNEDLQKLAVNPCRKVNIEKLLKKYGLHGIFRLIYKRLEAGKITKS